MKFTGRDLKKIQLPLTLSITLILIGSLLSWWSAGEAEKALRNRNSVSSKKEQTEARLRQVRTEEQELKERALTFQQLETAGITGDEKRLDWIEMLRTIQRDARLPGLTYEIGVQQPLDVQNEATYSWFSSSMRLQLRLLHEDDLLRTLALIEKRAPALVLVRSCTLSRSSNADPAQDALTHLTADCELQWITAQRNSRK